MEHYDLDIVGECARCDRSLVKQIAWRRLPRDVRQSLKKDFAGEVARRLCARCYTAAGADGTLIDYERKTMPLDIFAEEYTTMKQSGMTDQHIAEKLGLLSRSARWPSAQLDTMRKAIQRAEKAGLL